MGLVVLVAGQTPVVVRPLIRRQGLGRPPGKYVVDVEHPVAHDVDGLAIGGVRGFLADSGEGGIAPRRSSGPACDVGV